MRCPFCSADKESLKVIDSRTCENGRSIRRRRECLHCGKRFTTYERVEGVSLGVRKRDGRLEAYDRQKLLGGLLRAATKRPVSVPELEALAHGIEAQVRRQGSEMEAERIGELALRALIALDRVAAIRFASVYRNFDGLDDFEEELRRLESQPAAAPDQLLIGPVVDGADAPVVPSGAKSSMGRSPAASAAGRPESRATTRRVHAE
jgi:transcriptional repressor NrdR